MISSIHLRKYFLIFTSSLTAILQLGQSIFVNLIDLAPKTSLLVNKIA